MHAATQRPLSYLSLIFPQLGKQNCWGKSWMTFYRKLHFAEVSSSTTTKLKLKRIVCKLNITTMQSHTSFLFFVYWNRGSSISRKYNILCSYVLKVSELASIITYLKVIVYHIYSNSLTVLYIIIKNCILR